MDDDDDMADLFSFAADANPTPTTNPAPKTIPVSSEPARSRTSSDDSLLEMLATDGPSVASTSVAVDRDSQDILDWLDEDEKPATPSAAKPSTPGNATSQQNNTESQAPGKDATSKSAQVGDATKQSSESNSAGAEATPDTPQGPAATVVSLPPAFASFDEALASKESTPQQIRELYRKATRPPTIEPGERPELYCRMLFSKTLDDTVASSLADSFEKWEQMPLSQQPQWITDLARDWAVKVSEVCGRPVNDCQNDLTKIMLYYFKDSIQTLASDATGQQTSSVDADPLIPAVAAGLLSSSMPSAVASVLLSKALSSHMPLLSLKTSERWEATLLLHADFYTLATYHVPLLVLHLDRYMPGWYWPCFKSYSTAAAEDTHENDSATAISRNLQQQGQLPGSWFLTTWAASVSRSEKGSLSLDSVLLLWDKKFLLGSKDMQFFLALSLLQEHSDDLLLLTGEDLTNKFRYIFPSEGSADTSPDDFQKNVTRWWQQAESLRSRTPDSLIKRLSSSEDKALQQAVIIRQERAEEALQARLKAEAEAHQKSQEEKAKAARERLNRARLVAFYRIHAPGKEGNIDKIMETYEGRLSELDSKLRVKYGEGFNPALPKPVKNSMFSVAGRKKASSPSKSASKILAAMNRGLGRKTGGAPEEAKLSFPVAVSITPVEVLPTLCWSKEGSSSHGRRSTSSKKSLKYYLVDARSEEAANEQGKFPTSASLSPEALLDPERIKANEEAFESLRGAVHIVILGEGFSSLPTLYSQKLSPNLKELTESDESRTNMCALFFIKKGFPFVSILDGGFASAHSWLVREGPSHKLSVPTALVDYNPESVFAQMERMHNESASEKAQRVMQNLLDKSLVSMTRRAQQLERVAADLERGDRKLRMPQMPQMFKLGPQGEAVKFKNPFSLGEAGAAPSNPAEGLENVNVQSTQDSGTGGPSNPFDRFRQGTANKQPGPPKNPFKGIGAALNNSINQGAGNTPNGPPKNPFKGMGAALNNSINQGAAKINQSAAKLQADPPKNPFKGMGAALNNSVKTGMASVNKTATAFGHRANQNEGRPNPSVPGMLTRNPFARFGGPQQGSQASGSGQQTLGRMNPLWNGMKSTGDATSAEDEEEEVSISFHEGGETDPGEEEIGIANPFGSGVSTFEQDNSHGLADLKNGLADLQKV